MRVSKRNISKENIYLEDSLKRELEVALFTKLLNNAKGPYVISIDAPWGTGKTYFTEMIRENISSSIKSIYINAWESDFTTDPLITLISELKSVVDTKSFQAITDKFLSISKLVIPTAIKIASHGLINLDKIAEGISEVGEKLVLKKIEDYENEKKTIGELKNELKKSVQDTPNQKIVVFIDELDRCRPNYALEFLERVKHFFDVEGFIFVLSVDEKQLIESVKSLYGTNFEGEKYIRRFIDYKYFLKILVSKKFINDSFSRIGLDNLILTSNSLGQNRLEDAKDVLFYIANRGVFTPRDADQIISKINMFLLSFDEKKRVELFDLIIVLISLRHINSHLFFKYVNKECEPDDVLRELNLINDGLDSQGIENPVNSYLMGLILLQIKGRETNSKVFKNIKDLNEVESGLNHSGNNHSGRILRILRSYDPNIFDRIVSQLISKSDFSQ